MNISPSEQNGLKLLTPKDETIYSIGISTAGIAELEMVKNHNRRKVIATTIDQKGAAFATDFIAKNNKTSQIEVKIEDISKLLPYPNNYFDFIYARLVLHYLSKDVLDKTLLEIKRVLKKGKSLYIVVRSTKCYDANVQNATFDVTTGLTTYQLENNKPSSRYFHTEETISKHIIKSKLKLKYIKSNSEQLFTNFMRTVKSDNFDELIELVAVK